MWFQGPVAAQHLADLGAEVIHLENPKGGDLARGVASIKALPVGDWNQYFLVINRNKRSMAVDLKTDGGREILGKLIENTDVFLSNLSPGALEKWGCSYEALSAVNPRLIYAMGTGYGPKGTIDKPSFDMTVQALTGLMSRLGEPGQPPIYLGMGSGDAMGGLMAALAITLALYERRRSGQGQYLDASLYGAQLFMAAPSLQAYLAGADPRYRQQQSRAHAVVPTWNTYRADDGWLVLCASNTDTDWQHLCAALGREELAADERFDSAERRRSNEGLVALLDELFLAESAGHWVERLSAAGVAAAPVETLAAMAGDDGAWANDYLLKTHCAAVDREVDIRGLPIGMAATPGRVDSLGPELGQDTELILFEALGYDWDRIAEFKAGGVIL
jgi:crotonobetainyl-CoA:carnitine CoA-transferase CaiB-like acyl-CoA transferase